MFELTLFVAAGLVVLPLGYAVHCGLNRCCLAHAREYCRRQGLEIRRWRCGPEFDATGVKTEFTLVEVDCLDNRQDRRVVRLVVCLFGVRQVVVNKSYVEPECSPALKLFQNVTRSASEGMDMPLVKAPR